MLNIEYLFDKSPVKNKYIVNLGFNSYVLVFAYCVSIVYNRVCQKKKDILNIHVKSEGINIFSQKFG